MPEKPIPKHIKEKIEYNDKRKIQHEDLVRVLFNHERRRVSAYQIQQALDVNVSKNTVRERLEELVVLDVLNRHEYEMGDTFELEHRRLLADGGDLRHTPVKQLLIFNNIPALQNVSAGALYCSIVFMILSIPETALGLRPGLEQGEPIEVALTADSFVTSNSQFIEAGLMIFIFGVVLVLITGTLRRYREYKRTYLQEEEY